jgi:VanZ family protein
MRVRAFRLRLNGPSQSTSAPLSPVGGAFFHSSCEAITNPAAHRAQFDLLSHVLVDVSDDVRNCLGMGLVSFLTITSTALCHRAALPAFISMYWYDSLIHRWRLTV